MKYGWMKDEIGLLPWKMLCSLAYPNLNLPSWICWYGSLFSWVFVLLFWVLVVRCRFRQNQMLIELSFFVLYASRRRFRLNQKQKSILWTLVWWEPEWLYVSVCNKCLMTTWHTLEEELSVFLFFASLLFNWAFFSSLANAIAFPGRI